MSFNRAARARQWKPPYSHPSQAGADCANCPIARWHRTNGSSIDPIWPDGPNAATLAIVGDCPGKNEVKAGVPFSGASGIFLKQQLATHGLEPSDVWLDNSILCFPPGGSLDDFETVAKREWTLKVKRDPSLSPYKSALQCCRPRLIKTLRLSRCSKCSKPAHFDEGVLDQYRCTCAQSQPMKLKAKLGAAPRAMLLAGNGALESITGTPGVAARSAYVFNAEQKRAPAFVPSFHPAFLARGAARLSGLFSHALDRAVRLSEGTWKPKWTDEDLIRPPSNSVTVTKTVQRAGKSPLKFYKVKTSPKWPVAKMLREIRKLTASKLSFDFETDGISHYGWKYLLDESRAEIEASDKESKEADPLKPRCLGIYNGRRGLVIPFLWRKYKALPEGGYVTQWHDYWSAEARIKINAALSELLSAARQLRTQNGQFDRAVAHPWLDLGDLSVKKRHFDTFITHHTVASFLPHDLGSLSSTYTDAPFYKATLEGDSWSSASDEELWLYCGRDTKTTYQVSDKLILEVEGQDYDAVAVNDHDHWQERQCEAWTRTGVEMDPTAVRFFRRDYQRKRDLALAKLRSLLPDDCAEGLTRLISGTDELSVSPLFDLREHFNPRSLPQLGFVISVLQIPMTERTLNGDLATGEDLILEALKTLGKLKVAPDDVRVQFLSTLLRFREADKLVGTYLSPVVSPIDGRLHAGFKLGPPTGRLASFSPNFQNVPALIRGMYVARPGHSLVAGDWDALELRLSAALSKDPILLKAFADYDAKIGPKVHVVNMCNIFGFKLEPEKFNGDLIEAGAALAKKYPGAYTASKSFAYAIAYGAGEGTVFEKCREVMPELDEKAFSILYERYAKVYSVLMAYQASLVEQGTKTHFIETSVLPRRGYFFEAPNYFGSSPEASEMQNLPYQGTAAAIVGKANVRVLEQLVIPWQSKLRRNEVLHQLGQIHDELLFEVPTRLVERFIPEAKRICEVDVLKGGIALPVAFHSSKRWKPILIVCGGECKGVAELDEGTREKCKVCKRELTIE